MRRFVVKRGQIWYAQLPNKVKHAFRPVVVINDFDTPNTEYVTIVPITHRYKMFRTHCVIGCVTKAYEDSIVQCENIMNIPKYCLKKLIRSTSTEEQTKIDEKLRLQLSL